MTGWREWVGLPDLDVDWIKAKIDTGARTSALHAFDVREFDRDGEDWVRFKVKPWQNSQEDAVTVECPVHDRRAVRSVQCVTRLRSVRLLARTICCRA